MKMNPVVHFEMSAEDKQRMFDFYSNTFGWEINVLGPEFGDYAMVMTTESDENGPKQLGAINGGFYQRTKADQVPRLVISVDNLVESLEKVKAAGGQLVGGGSGNDYDDIPGVGLYAGIIDTEGNKIGLLQPAPRS